MTNYTGTTSSAHCALRSMVWCFFVVLALGFALVTGSDAILFDGIYSLIALCVALLTLKVARLAQRPDDDNFHFGYTAMEPTLNLFKALFIPGGLCLCPGGGGASPAGGR